MKSVEFLIPETTQSDELHERFAASLSHEFRGYTKRPAIKYQRDGENKMFEASVIIYEVALESSNLDLIREFARPFADDCGGDVEIKLDGETYFVKSTDEVVSVAEPTVKEVSDWPDAFDIAIQTVIGTELHAVQDHFDIDRSDVRSLHGTWFYRGSVQGPTGTASVVVCCQDSAGNDAAAIFAERLINNWSPKAIFLMGIAAGRRDKCKIGDVITPRVVVDDTKGVAEAKKRLKRPRIYAPPHSMIQQLLNFRFDEAREEWHQALLEKTTPPIPPSGQEEEYQTHVADLPSHHDAAIYSSDLLLRDADILEGHSRETHQQIRIGEMEAAGFGAACNTRDRPIPWFIVRAVSDFGDEFKNDAFHKWGAHAAASYLHVLIRHGIDVTLLEA